MRGTICPEGQSQLLSPVTCPLIGFPAVTAGSQSHIAVVVMVMLSPNEQRAKVPIFTTQKSLFFYITLESFYSFFNSYKYSGISCPPTLNPYG